MLDFITENDIFKIINDISPDKKRISSTTDLKNDFLSSEEITALVHEIQTRYGISIDSDLIDTPIKIADTLNNIKGADKMTIRSLIDEICMSDPESDALTFDSITYTHSELYDNILRLACGFLSIGVTKNTHVVIILENSLEYILSYFALFYIGAVIVPINTRWNVNEAVKVIIDSEAEYFITKEHSGKLKFSEVESNLLLNSHIVKKVIYCDNDENGNSDFSALLKAEKLELPDNIFPQDIAMISYTSGTTGTPKGVMLRHLDVTKISLYTKQIWASEKEESFSIAPLYSAQGFLSLLINFSIGSRFKMISSFNTNDILREISKRTEKAFHTQPTMWTMLLNSRAINFADFRGLEKIVVSGSLCSPELAKRIEKRLNCKLLNAYGLIEGTSVVTMTRYDDSDDVRINTVGRPIPGVEIKIVDENRKIVKHGEIGELAIKGYNMAGYYKNEEKTQEILDNEGWLYTGDLARYYDDENISIVGRCKDMIIRGGYNVYPSDVEEIILQIPEVQSVAVVGRPHEILGEEIIAFVVLKAGMTIKKNDILRYVFNNLANYKLPDQIYLISDMPAILAGKIDKKVLSEWAVNGIPDDKEKLFSF